MAIGAVVKELAHFRVYDETGHCTAIVPVADNADTLVGYTGSTFAVSRGHGVIIYDAHGKMVGHFSLMRPAMVNPTTNAKM